MENFDAILERATERIGPDFFLLPIEDAPARYRERVYCYELYHQMRTLWPIACHWSLNGEVDKGGHPRFEGDKAPKPDFLVHMPGQPNNFAAVEVKTANVSRRGLLKDIATLQRFLGIGYERAILLIYGLDAEKARRKVCHWAGKGQLNRIELWVHTQYGQRAEPVELHVL